jgi:hypothetical protein
MKPAISFQSGQYFAGSNEPGGTPSREVAHRHVLDETERIRFLHGQLGKTFQFVVIDSDSHYVHSIGRNLTRFVFLAKLLDSGLSGLLF